MVAVLVTTIALVVLAGAATMHEGAPTTLLTTVATIGVTLGVGGFVYEAVLREAAVAETVELLELRASIVATGLKELTADASVDWHAAFRQASQATLILGSPFGWLEQVWPHILEAGGLRAIDVTVAIPGPDSEGAATLAVRDGRAVDETRQQLRNLTAFLSDSWTNAIGGHSPLKMGSKLTVKIVSYWPSFDLILTNTDVFVRLHALEHRRPGDPVMTSQLNASVNTFPVAWLKQEATRLDEVGAHWEKEVR